MSLEHPRQQRININQCILLMVLSRFTLDIDARNSPGGYLDKTTSAVHSSDPKTPVKNHHGSSSPNKQLIEIKLPMYAYKQVYIHNTLSMVSEFQTYIHIYIIYTDINIYIYMDVSLNGATPNLHPKMMIYYICSKTKKTCWVPAFWVIYPLIYVLWIILKS